MSDRDTITLPREVVKFVLQHLEWWSDDEPQEKEAIEALRKALAAEPTKPEPVAWLSRDEARLALWKAINSREFGNPTDEKLILDHLRQQGLWIGKVTSPVPPATHPGYIIGSHWLETAYSRICAGEAEADVLRDCGWERVDDAEALRTALAAPRLEVTVDLRLTAEEAAAISAAIDARKKEQSEDIEALRRDAERYRWLRERAWFQFEVEVRYGDSGETVQELDAAIDAAMGDKT